MKHLQTKSIGVKINGFSLYPPHRLGNDPAHNRKKALPPCYTCVLMNKPVVPDSSEVALIDGPSTVSWDMLADTGQPCRQLHQSIENWVGAELAGT